MVWLEPLDVDSSTLPRLPSEIHPWLRALVILALLSFISSIILLALLTYRVLRWRIKAKRINQFAILILNLLWADTQQAIGFFLNVEWLRLDAIVVENPICAVQGWLISTGDLASGVWCFAIALHTFASVLFNYRLPNRYFYMTIVFLWSFIYGVSAIGMGRYSHHLYVRSGIWCWIHHDLGDLRLWTHYVWIFIFEFGNILVYALIYAVLLHRIRSNHYTAAAAKRVKAISNLMVVYPVVYVICTLPLASVRMATMRGEKPSLSRLCLAGALITSNGWLDVLLYTLTRRIMVFSDEPPEDDNGIDTFTAFWTGPDRRFGGACTIVATPTGSKRGRGLVSLRSYDDMEDALCAAGSRDIKLVTTTQVVSEPAKAADRREMDELARKMRPRTPVTRRGSEDSAGLKELDFAVVKG